MSIGDFLFIIELIGSETLKKLNYKEKFIQMNKEARATWILFLIMLLWWIFTGIFLKDVNIKIFYMPLWAFLSTIGTMIISTIGVIILVKKVFVNFELDEDEEDFIEEMSKDHE